VPRVDQDVALGRNDGARHAKGQRAPRLQPPVAEPADWPWSRDLPPAFG
jgi:hypothetical protein